MGRVVDPETGLIYLRNRYYDPTTAQFLTRDPLDALTRSAYGYVDGNPLNGSDPTGLCFGGIFGKHCKNVAAAVGNALDVGATVLAYTALVADATGVGAPIGVILGGASAALSVASAGVHCAYGTARECAISAAVAALSIVTVGLASPLTESAGDVAKLSKPLIRGIQLGADAVGLAAGVLTNPIHPFGTGSNEGAGCPPPGGGGTFALASADR